MELVHKQLKEILLNEDRSLIIKNSILDLTLSSFFVYQRQKKDFLITISGSVYTEQYIIQKIVFENNQASFYQIKQVPLYNYAVFYSLNINSIIEYNQIDCILKISILDSNSEQIIKQFNITSQELNQINIFENQWDNSTYIFYIQNKLIQFINMTDYLRIIAQDGEIQIKIEQLAKTVDTPFITELSTLTTVIFYQNNILDIFIQYILNKIFLQQLIPKIILCKQFDGQLKLINVQH
ncbi:hypothetical protein TTHERM_000826773 (macronuclear) [Tetrahymena thermophila SB210]|uniref:Uncharacterized protein n=1 Tax=Tetrahymena thermophila (strain SB210) TaxID=312017 RepID=W7X4G1_TETTS|nr:hypothetical protein TTHERM_000826773 [Tetrahymena thermophila SB210]EWS74215.1 hypothetical protein TTHERM_000826773 [Tetrahymena thermophila SB210]|eukprot:XP_012653243.1 hypothetical protein TTHERM_000826773 [Tetrahymena thermophila SB210]